MSNRLSENVYSVRLDFCVGDVCHTLDAVYLDSLPTGSPIGTAIMLHGSPGSHEDFKYITPLLMKKGIRVVAPNFPGYGLTEDLLSLQHNNIERNSFVTALLDHLKLTERLIFVGHSRGTENTVMLSVLNKNRAVGTILVNSTGFRPYKGIRPYEMFEAFAQSYSEANAIGKGKMEQSLVERFGESPLRFASGRMAAVCMLDVATMELPRMEEWIEQLNKVPHLRLLIAYGGSDTFLEPEITRELADKVVDRLEIVVDTKDDDENTKATEDMKQAFVKDCRKAVVVEFSKDDHFVQKHRASFVAEAVDVMLSVDSTHSPNNKL